MSPTALQKKEVKAAIDRIYPLGTTCWSAIEPLIYLRQLEKGDYFSKEGQFTRELGLLSRGILRIFYLDDKGEEWNKHFLLEGDLVAASISPDKKAISSIQALEQTTIVCLPYPALMKASSQFEAIRTFIQKLSFGYLEQKEQREISLLSEDASHNYLKFKEKYPNIEDKIPHYHIASFLGITPTQLSRIRKNKSHQQM